MQAESAGALLSPKGLRHILSAGQCHHALPDDTARIRHFFPQTCGIGHFRAGSLVLELHCVIRQPIQRFPGPYIVFGGMTAHDGNQFVKGMLIAIPITQG